MSTFPMLNMSKFFNFYPRTPPPPPPVGQLAPGSIEKKENKEVVKIEESIIEDKEVEIKHIAKEEYDIKTVSVPISAPKVETLEMDIVITKPTDQIMGDGLGSALMDSLATSDPVQDQPVQVAKIVEVDLLTN